ncbi:hypothetical protein BHE74_00052379 [Ensete ventricosum]|nr:hypothetical protein BHE74_00052379 [Ensete ventricosum]
MSLTGHIRMCCIVANYSTTIRCTMSPPGDVSIVFRFLCDELRLRSLIFVRSLGNSPSPTHSKFRRPPSPLDYSVLLNNLCLVLPPQMHLLDCDSSPIQSPLHPSRQRNAKPRLLIVPADPTAAGKADGGSDVAGGPPLPTILAGVVVVFLLLCWVVGSIAMWLVGFIVSVVRRAPPQVRRARRRNPSALLRHAPPIVTRKESRRTVSAGDEAARARSRRKSKGGLPERKSLLPISNRRPASLLRKMRIRRPEDGAPGIGIVLAMALEKVR